jgi:hypothetical protein
MFVLVGGGYFICEAEDYFGGKTDQVVVYTGVGVQGNLELLSIFNIFYSQRNKFFRLQGRQNFELLGLFGKDTYKKYNCLVAGLSQDVIIPVYKGLFIGTGLGIFISNKKTDRVSSNFTFGEKIFVGIKCNNEVIELLGRHFSNGDLTGKNKGYNFVGIAVVHIF